MAAVSPSSRPSGATRGSYSPRLNGNSGASSDMCFVVCNNTSICAGLFTFVASSLGNKVQPACYARPLVPSSSPSVPPLLLVTQYLQEVIYFTKNPCYHGLFRAYESTTVIFTLSIFINIILLIT
jgi:hypothetical protein